MLVHFGIERRLNMALSERTWKISFVYFTLHNELENIKFCMLADGYLEYITDSAFKYFAEKS